MDKMNLPNKREYSQTKMFYSDDLLWQKQEHQKKTQNGSTTRAVSENDKNEIAESNEHVISPWMRLSVTACVFATGLFVGLNSGAVGPTLVHMTMLYSSTTLEISRGIAVSNATYFIGSLLTALIFDWFNPRLLHTGILFCMGLFIGWSPFMPNLYGYQSMIACAALGQGIVHSSVPAIIFNLWKDHKLRAPFLQTYFMLWNIGMFLCPLIAMPFLVEIPEKCRALHEQSPLPVKSVKMLTEDVINQTEFNNTNLNQAMHLFLSLKDDEDCVIDASNVQYVYVIVGVYGLSISIMYFATFLTNKPSLRSKESTKKSQVNDNNIYVQNKAFKFIIICGGAMFFFILMYFVYVPALFLSSFAIRGLGWSVGKASLMTSLYSGSQTLGRLFSVLVVYVLSPEKLLTINLTVSLLAFTLMVSAPIVSDAIMWVSVALAGISGSPMNAVMFLWLGQYVPVTSALGSIMLMSASGSGFSVSILMGKLFDINHMFMVYMSLIAVLCNICLFAALNVYLKFKHKPLKSDTDLKPELQGLHGARLAALKSQNQHLISSTVSLF